MLNVRRSIAAEPLQVFRGPIARKSEAFVRSRMPPPAALLCHCLAVTFLIAGCATSLEQRQSSPARPTASLNDHWAFLYGDSTNPSQLTVPPSTWQRIALPHTWNAQDGADGGGNYQRGTGTYVRTFSIDPAWQGKRIFLQFDGASRRAIVFVNGRKIGEHDGAFARFRFDITPAIRFGAENLLTVQVSNADDGLPPISADFTFFGGLYRSMSLFATDPVHVDALDFGADAFYIRQDRVSVDKAELTIRLKLRNDGNEAKRATLRFELRSGGGQIVAHAETSVEIATGAFKPLEQSIEVMRPHLWNGRKDPYLYTARASLLIDGVIVDEVSQRVGLRSFRVDPNEGFFLNGAHLDLHGTSRHQDRAGKGWAIGAAEDREDFGFLQEIGATAIRVAHYPQSDLWFDLADENGLVAWSEIPVVNEVPDTKVYADNAELQLRELIRQHYNHPSICFWGVGNETRELTDKVGHETPSAPTADRVITALNVLGHEEDFTRLSTYASHHRGDDRRNFRTDVMAFNKYPGWYGGKAADLGKALDQVHKQFPTLRIGISEYGAGANIVQHDASLAQPKPGGSFHPEEYQSYVHEQQWEALAARPYVWCKFVWNLFDFASDNRAEGENPGINDKGLVTSDRKTRKDAFYWYKANWSEAPVLYIAERRFVERRDAHLDLKVYSNASEVEMVLNGKSLGWQKSTNHIFHWPAGLTVGENHVVARAQFGDHEVTDECTFTLHAKDAPHD
jgi:beta-galactosidase